MAPTSFFPAKEVIPGLWVGSARDASDAAFLKRARIGFIVNCSRDIPFFFPDQIPGIRVAVNDSPSENLNMFLALPDTVRAMSRRMSTRVPILVHCYAGISRSSTVAAAFIMSSKNMCMRDAVDMIRAQKPETFTPYVVFDKCLAVYDKVKTPVR